MMSSLVRLFVSLLFSLIVAVPAVAQVTGVVYDSENRRPLDYVNVYYEGKGAGTQTDLKGRFSLMERDAWDRLTVSSLGYETKVVKLRQGKKKNLRIYLKPAPREIAAVTITGKKKKYTRKENPAVIMMNKVIAAKEHTDIRERDFCSFSRYEKMTFSLNEFTEKVFEQGQFKNMQFLKEHVERAPHSGKLILPLTVNERLSETYMRKSPSTEKTIVKAESDKGVNQLINTGEIMTTALKDVFTDVDIYDNECRLLQSQFKSPIADNAVSFYRYYIEDTLMIDSDKVFKLTFTPNNQQDFGFSGDLYIMADSSWQVRRVSLSIPARSDVNFVENMQIIQDYERLPSGERVVTSNDMLIELALTDWLNKVLVQRTARTYDYSFDSIPPSTFKRVKGKTMTEPDARMQDDAYWAENRKVELSESESKMGSFIDRIQEIKGFKYLIIGVKALFENFVETSDSTATNKFDIGPINTAISFNHYDKVRFRFSGVTTAHLHPHLFARGYVAYGVNTKNPYGQLELTYAFNKRQYLMHEFLKNNLSVGYRNDIVSPFDKFINTDKDNVFMALKAGTVDQFNRVNEWKVTYDREWETGMKFLTTFTHTNNEAVDALFYQPLGTGVVTADGRHEPLADRSKWIKDFNTAELKATVSYEPGATYVNSKQRRIRLNEDAPIYSLSHTWGIKGLLGGDYNYHVTEAGIYKRFWLGSWGRIDTDTKAGAQWSKVPFPLLIHPAANQSYIYKDNTFNLIGNMEFLNDRYASLMVAWDMNGKLFNRIPLLKHLHWRELLGFNVLWGSLSDRNNPASSGYTDSDLFYFPGHFRADGTYELNTCVMDPKKPYVELRLGIHNIFKFLQVEYTRRLTYLDNPGVNTDGFRIALKMSF